MNVPPLHEGDRAIAWSAHLLFDDRRPGCGGAFGACREGRLKSQIATPARFPGRKASSDRCGLQKNSNKHVTWLYSPLVCIKCTVYYTREFSAFQHAPNQVLQAFVGKAMVKATALVPVFSSRCSSPAMLHRSK